MIESRPKEHFWLQAHASCRIPKIVEFWLPSLVKQFYRMKEKCKTIYSESLLKAIIKQYFYVGKLFFKLTFYEEIYSLKTGKIFIYKQIHLNVVTFELKYAWLVPYCLIIHNQYCHHTVNLFQKILKYLQTNRNSENKNEWKNKK